MPVNGLAAELTTQVASLRRYARALVRDRGDSDDLVQETLARALSRADRFQPGTNLRAWLFTIMHNLHVNQVRQSAARPPEVPVDDALGQLVSAPQQEARVQLHEMSAALALLPEEQRQVLLLIAMEGLKYEEVAQILGVPVGTVMSRLSRARHAMRCALASEGGVSLRRVK